MYRKSKNPFPRNLQRNQWPRYSVRLIPSLADEAELQRRLWLGQKREYQQQGVEAFFSDCNTDRPGSFKTVAVGLHRPAHCIIRPPESKSGFTPKSLCTENAQLSLLGRGRICCFKKRNIAADVCPLVRGAKSPNLRTEC